MIHPFGVTGFNLLTALSTRNDEPHRASRPFDRDRDGFVLGEGAAMVVLESLEARQGPRRPDLRRDRRLRLDRRRLPNHRHASRGPRRDQLHDDGPGRRRRSAEDVDYINAHGTSTAVNDRVETLAIKRVFGDRAYKIPISSTKSMMGHLIAAAGATELIICLLAIRDNVVPPTINYENARSRLRPGLCAQRRPAAPLRLALTNSFGFGGQNISLLVSRLAG